VFIYDLMMNHVIEREGCWGSGVSTQAADGQAFRLLAERISRVTSYTPAEVGRHLTGAVERGDLVCQGTDGKTQWQWKDGL
jgi:hypothetical protein